MDQSDWCVEKHPSWGRNRETYEDALVSNQARDDGNSDLYVSSENKWPDSRSVLEVEPAGFSDRWMVECKGKGTIKAFCLRNWKMEFRVKLSFCKWERFISVHFSLSVVSTSLQPHGPQHTRPPCPSPTPKVFPNSCPLSQWCHPTISPSVIPFSSCPQSFPASGSFPMSQLFASGGQNIRVSASALVPPTNIQDWFPLGWTGWISLLSRGFSRVFSNTTVQKHQLFGAQPSL